MRWFDGGDGVNCAVSFSIRGSGLDAVVVSAPVDDALFDSFRFEVLGEGLAEERGKFIIGGEAERNELLDAELVDVDAIFGRQECVEAEAFFEANDAVLRDEGAVTTALGDHEDDEGHEDPPQEKSTVLGPVVNGDVDGEDEVQQKHGQNEEVKGRIEAAVVLEVLWGRHWSPLRSRLCRRASAYHLR